MSVMVNGKTGIEKGEHIRGMPGKVLRRHD